MNGKNEKKMGISRTQNTIRNIIYRIGGQIISILLKFVSRTVFVQTLGATYLGINGLFSEILQMLALADLGFGTAMVFSMYQPLAEHNHKKLAQLVALYRKIYATIAVSISVIGIGLIPFLRYLVNFDEEIPHLYVYYFLYLANTVASYTVVYKTCILNADQRNYIISKCDTLFNFLSTILSCLFLYITHDFLVYLIIQVLMTYARNLYESKKASALYPYINQKYEKLPKDETRKIFGSVKSIFIYKMANTLVGSTDNTLISIMLGTVIVGLYSNYSLVVTNIQYFINIVFASVTASLGNLIVEKNKEKNYGVYCTMQFVSFIISPVALTCVYCLINDFVNVWLGQDYVLNQLAVIAIVVNMYFSIILMPIWSYREATGIFLQTKYVMISTAIVNLVVSIILGKMIGLAGILFATSIAKLTTYFWYEPKLLFTQYFGQKVSRYYLNIVYNIFVTIITLFIIDAATIWMIPHTWIYLIGKACLVGMGALIITIIMNIRNPEMKKTIATIRHILRKA